jgi:predicted dehydrogenase
LTESQLGILVVGVGFIADVHIGAIAADPRATLAGVVDTDPARVRSYSQRNGGVRHSTDLAEALAWDGVDGVIVCTPNDTHAAIALQVAAAGKHLLVEKPLATSVADARSVVVAFEQAGRVLMAAHTHRAYDYGRTVKQIVDRREIGRVTLVRLAILGGWIWPDWSAWVLDPRRSGGHALHNGVHLLDLAAWWLGSEPRTIMARGRRETSAGLGIYDYLEMVLTCADGSTAICEMSRAHRPGALSHRDVLLAGTDGLITLGWDDEASLVIDEKGTSAVPAAGHDGFAIQLASWLDAVEGGDVTMSTDDAVRAVAMGVAVERSIAAGRPLELAGILRGSTAVAR